MKLITKEIEKLFEKFPIYSQEKTKKGEQVVLCKFFGGSSCTWYVLEAEKKPNGDYEFFGYANIGFGFEMGYFTLSELARVKFPPFGLGVERDTWFDNGKVKVKELNLDGYEM